MNHIIPNSPAFFLMKRGVPIDQGVLGYWNTSTIDGWSHFDITRDEAGLFKVYINNTLRIEAQDNTYATSNSLWMNTETGTNIGFDNFVVKDDISSIQSSSTSTSVTIDNSTTTNVSISNSTSSDSRTDDTSFSPISFLGLPIVVLVYQNYRRRKNGGFDLT
ncbi:MAG: hypothetical protein GPJ54_19320 [Candidatus Heimdallarchaeota archaeon]|nr:hypothetical protein [Candidatus Heimdallarchaeota archaeon]